MARKQPSRGVLRREDPSGGRRVRTAALHFAAAMVGLGGSLAWVILTADGGPSDGWAALATLVFLLAVLAATANVFRRLLVYRCPRYRARASQVPLSQPGDQVVYHCARCNVEWDTGWTVSDSSD
jgi:hypothetical protein